MTDQTTPKEFAKFIEVLRKGGPEAEKLLSVLESTNRELSELEKKTKGWMDALKGWDEVTTGHETFAEQARVFAKDYNEEWNKLTESGETVNKHIKAMGAGMDQITGKQKKLVTAAKQMATEEEARLETMRAQGLEGTEQFEQQEETLELVKESVTQHEKDLEAIKAATKEINKQVEGYKKVEKATEAWATQLTGVTKSSFEDSVLGTISSVGSLSQVLSTAGKTMGQVFTASNMLGSGVTKIIESTVMMVGAFDQAQASFYKTTGAAGEYGDIIQDVRSESVNFGVNIDDAGRAVGVLYTQMRDFSDMTDEAKTQVTNFTARMDQLGVSASVTADLLDAGTKSLNMTVKESQNMVLEITEAARAIGVPVAQMNEELKAAMPTLAAYGAEGVKVFKNLAAQAKAAGVATGDLLGIAERFDTFQTAAESVGKLNGMLGGNYLNSLEMVNMTEDERIRTLVQTIELSGKNWHALDKYERKAIAASVGITDAAVANRLLGSSVEDLDAKMNAADAGILSPEQMEEMADKARNFMEKLTNIGQSLAVMFGPIVTAIHAVLDTFIWLNDFLKGALAPAVLTAAGAFLWLTMSQAASKKAAAADAVTRLMAYQTKAAEMTITHGMTVAQAEETLAKITNTGATNIGTAATKKSIFAKGAEFVATKILAAGTWLLNAAKIALAVTAGITAVAVGGLAMGMWALAAATYAAVGPLGLIVLTLLGIGVALFVALHSPPLWVGLGLLVGLMIALAIAGVGAAAPMTAFGTAMLFVGAGVALAGIGFLMAGVGVLFFGAGMVLVAAALVIAAVALWVVVGAILALGAGLVIIGLLSWIAAPGLIMLGIAILMLTSMLIGFASVSWLVLPPLFILAVIVAMIALSMARMFEAMNAGVGSLAGIGAGLKDIAAAMAEMSMLSVLKFLLLTEGVENMAGTGNATPALQATADVIRSTIEVDTSKVEAVEDLIDSLNLLAITAAVSPGLMIAGAVLGGLSGVFGGAEAGGKEGKGQDILLVLDEDGQKVIGKAVDVYIQKKHRASAR